MKSRWVGVDAAIVTTSCRFPKSSVARARVVANCVGRRAISREALTGVERWRSSSSAAPRGSVERDADDAVGAVP